jgi:hypothetical protein
MKLITGREKEVVRTRAPRGSWGSDDRQHTHQGEHAIVHIITRVGVVHDVLSIMHPTSFVNALCDAFLAAAQFLGLTMRDTM